jgi:adenine-specific DNA methylase
VSSNANDRTFIETQFPVAKLSKESYAERSAKQSQTLTGLGKWWGRKPLVLCRATLLGLLLPSTDDPAADRDVFLRLMTMDDAGMLRRRSQQIPGKELFRRLPPADRERWFRPGSTEASARFKKGVSKEEKDALQRAVFLSLSYDERLEYCDRPEHVDGPPTAAWTTINKHLDTKAGSIAELVAELGRRRFGHVPYVGDCFSGGGSIPYEAARLGASAFASDLSPVSAMLTWASLNIVGGGEDTIAAVQEMQRTVHDAVDRQITEWGIEHRESDSITGRRWRADAYLYCAEVTCPECQWRVPLSPSWVIGRGSRTIAHLIPDPKRKRFDFEILSGVTEDELTNAAATGTAADTGLVCPNSACLARTPIKAIRGDGRGSFGDARSVLRGWEASDVLPQDGDVFGERLYCIRWVDRYAAPNADGDYREVTDRYFRAPTPQDLEREEMVLDLLKQRFSEWQRAGFIPSRRIEPGAKTIEPIRTRGWTHWHHLFTPRQLLVNGLLAERSEALARTQAEKVTLLLAVGRCADWNSRLCRWDSSPANEKSTQTYSNQALNTLANYGCRPLLALENTWFARLTVAPIAGSAQVLARDARSVETTCDIWITDPPYADAVAYEEVSELFLSWYERRIPAIFPEWYADSKRALAVRGDEESFRKAMVDCYRRLADRMPDNGLQVVMFTHQSAAVWADLALILWAAGLRVTAAWCIATETTSELKDGNYVQGTVLLVLRKQGDAEPAFLDEVTQDVEAEVRRQIDTMRDLDDSRDPSFSDTDYQLAAYAAALRVLTSKHIEELDVGYELTRSRTPGTKSVLEEVIDAAVRIACDHLIPVGIEPHLWKGLLPEARFYLKGLEMEAHGERRSGVYQELARGFGVQEYTNLLASTKANETRLRTASEFGRRDLGSGAFGASLVRHALFAAHKAIETEGPRESLTWLSTEVPDYATSRSRIIELLDYLATLGSNASMPHWQADAAAAALVAGALRNRQDNV